jgi:hypothetical protein
MADRWTSEMKPETDERIGFSALNRLLDHQNRGPDGKLYTGFQSRSFTRFTKTPCTEENGVSCFRSDNNNRDLIAYGLKVEGQFERDWRLTGWGSTLLKAIQDDYVRAAS